jgi:CheY-like chemotaxis protein
MSVVLVVEDEALILVLAESVLNDAGYETLSASSLSERSP